MRRQNHPIIIITHREPEEGENEENENGKKEKRMLCLNPMLLHTILSFLFIRFVHFHFD